jgi:hypothetical protein
LLVEGKTNYKEKIVMAVKVAFGSIRLKAEIIKLKAESIGTNDKRSVAFHLPFAFCLLR